MDLTPALAELDERESLYVQARLKGMSMAASAAAAGLAAGSGAAVEGRAVVKAALARGRELTAKATGVTREEIIEMLRTAYSVAETAGEMVAAARELAKLQGLYEATKVEVKHEVRRVKGVDKLRSLPVEQLERIARGELVIEGEFTEVEPRRLTHGGKAGQDREEA